jgi:hypothetical protein
MDVGWMGGWIGGLVDWWIDGFKFSLLVFKIKMFDYDALDTRHL